MRIGETVLKLLQRDRNIKKMNPEIDLLQQKLENTIQRCKSYKHEVTWNKTHHQSFSKQKSGFTLGGWESLSKEAVHYKIKAVPVPWLLKTAEKKFTFVITSSKMTLTWDITN